MLQAGDWIGNLPPEGPKVVYHVDQVDHTTGRVEARSFQVEEGSGRLADPEFPTTVTGEHLAYVRVIHGSSNRKKFLYCNPTQIPEEWDTYWLYEGGDIKSLSWDPGEWMWGKIPGMRSVPFLDYTVKRGYKTGMLRQGKPSTLIRILDSQGFQDAAQRSVLSFLWHGARPKKINTFLWAVANKALATGSWLQKIGRNEVVGCALCGDPQMETYNHLFWSCSVAGEIWRWYHQLARRHNGTIFTSWQHALLGEYSVMHTGSTCAKHVYPGQPWDLLRGFIIWFIWLERCNLRFQKEQYSFERLLKKAWIATVQAGHAIWRSIHAACTEAEVLQVIEAAFFSE